MKVKKYLFWHISLLVALIFCTTSTTFSQKIDREIDKLVKLQTKQKSCVRNSQTGLMEDLIDYILLENYDGKYSGYTIPFTFDTLSFNSKIYYYQSALTSNRKTLFYWCYKNSNDKWSINSVILDSIEDLNGDFRLNLYLDEDKEVFLLKSYEGNFLFLSDDVSNIMRINFNFDREKDYSFKYVETRIENESIKWSSRRDSWCNDLILDSLYREVYKLSKDYSYQRQTEIFDALELRTQYVISITPKEKIVYLTQMQADDINCDGKIDYYWLAISNGMIVYYEAYNLIDSNFINVSEKFEMNMFKDNNYIKKHIELSE